MLVAPYPKGLNLNRKSNLAELFGLVGRQLAKRLERPLADIHWPQEAGRVGSCRQQLRKDLLLPLFEGMLSLLPPKLLASEFL